MKIKQVKLIYSDECTNTFYGFQGCVNEWLKNLYLDSSISDVAIEHYSKDFIVIGYLKDMNERDY